jgi:hypothetical protein
MTLAELAYFGALGQGSEKPRGNILNHLVWRRSFREPLRRTLTADIAANIIRNVWSYAIEHHLYPDMPSTRYGEIAPKVREIYGRPCNSGPFHKQFGMVQRTIVRLALPGGQVRPKPGAYAGPLIRGKGERPVPEMAVST